MQLSVKIKQIDCLYLRRFKTPDDCLRLHELGRWDHISVSPLSCLAVLAILAVALSASSAGHGLARSAPCRVAAASAARSGAGGREWALQSLGLVQLLGLPCRDCRSTPMSRSPPRRSAEFPWRTRTRSSSSAPRATWRRRRPVRGPVALPMLVSAVDCLLLLCACTDCVVTLC